MSDSHTSKTVLPSGISFLVLVFFLFTGTGAVAEKRPVSVLVGPEAGVIWFFLFDTDDEEIRMNPQVSYGGHVTVISDFEWARNIALEARYGRSEGRGEKENNDGETNLFDLTSDRMHLNVSYYFGGVIYDPYISGGLGVTRMDYAGRHGKQKGDRTVEWDFSVNLGGGLDFKFSGFDYLSIGLRIQYIYIRPTEYDVGHIGALMPSLRLTGRF